MRIFLVCFCALAVSSIISGLAVPDGPLWARLAIDAGIFALLYGGLFYLFLRRAAEKPE